MFSRLRFFFLLFILYWSIVDYQFCVGFLGVQPSGSVIHVSILFQILFPFRLLHNIEQSSLCPCWLSIFAYFFKTFYFVLEYNGLTTLQ